MSELSPDLLPGASCVIDSALSCPAKFLQSKATRSQAKLPDPSVVTIKKLLLCLNTLYKNKHSLTSTRVSKVQLISISTEEATVTEHSFTVLL